MIEKKLALASDHAGFELKEEVKKFLLELGYAPNDFGVEGFESVYQLTYKVTPFQTSTPISLV
jgi:Ribose 5-phosphate isomerase RpiB